MFTELPLLEFNWQPALMSVAGGIFLSLLFVNVVLDLRPGRTSPIGPLLLALAFLPMSVIANPPISYMDHLIAAALVASVFLLAAGMKVLDVDDAYLVTATVLWLGLSHLHIFFAILVAAVIAASAGFALVWSLRRLVQGETVTNGMDFPFATCVAVSGGLTWVIHPTITWPSVWLN